MESTSYDKSVSKKTPTGDEPVEVEDGKEFILRVEELKT